MEIILNDIDLFIPKTSMKKAEANANYFILSDC